jgi:serine phosphatase RsbU (regulator of sigma subunit)
MFITAQLAFLDGNAREIVIANAGHCPALLFSDAHSEPDLISPEGMPLGILRNAFFIGSTHALTDNCRLLLHTDGITEARSPDGEIFGHARLVDWLRHTSQFHDAEQIKESLAGELNRFGGHVSSSDDQTFLIVAQKPFDLCQKKF